MPPVVIPPPTDTPRRMRSGHRGTTSGGKPAPRPILVNGHLEEGRDEDPAPAVATSRSTRRPTSGGDGSPRPVLVDGHLLPAPDAIDRTALFPLDMMAGVGPLTSTTGFAMGIGRGESPGAVVVRVGALALVVGALIVVSANAISRCFRRRRSKY
ncbi:unnamed protein product [Mycena citricolor]|uniref:Uncharacterized protein n=1 Tax=Mycena citricolor TaxID=2018698 RepID=A0AAD2H1S1_9AGAR|nr:unnamed protein product [Mycena citricolor]CAK5283376.1 unnamed protein product [Mycena citricolor]